MYTLFNCYKKRKFQPPLPLLLYEENSYVVISKPITNLQFVPTAVHHFVGSRLKVLFHILREFCYVQGR